MKTIFLLIAILFTFSSNSFACNGSSISIASQVTNADGSITYTLNLTTELGGFDATFYGFALSFNSAFNTPTVVIGGTFPTTTTIANSDLTLILKYTLTGFANDFLKFLCSLSNIRFTL